MEPKEIEHFVKGLKIVIQTAWKTQEAFAEGVTSKVNLSNILRGQGGTSQKMREALASKAGMSVDEIVAIGKGKDLAEQVESPPTEFVERRRNPHYPTAPLVEDVTKMESLEILSMVNNHTLVITENLVNHTKSMTETCKQLVIERDNLRKKLSNTEAILNAVTDIVKVVDKDMRVTYCNRAATQQLGQHVGDPCKGTSNCAPCKDGCFAEKVFASGSMQIDIIELKGVHYSRIGYPIVGANGIVNQVLMFVRDSRAFVSLWKELQGVNVENA